MCRSQANVPLKANDVLFRIDPTPFEAQVAGASRRSSNSQDCACRR